MPRLHLRAFLAFATDSAASAPGRRHCTWLYAPIRRLQYAGAQINRTFQHSSGALPHFHPRCALMAGGAVLPSAQGSLEEGCSRSGFTGTRQTTLG